MARKRKQRSDSITAQIEAYRTGFSQMEPPSDIPGHSELNEAGLETYKKLWLGKPCDQWSFGDLVQIVQAAQATETIKDLQALVEDDGYVVESAAGTKKSHPALTSIETNRKRIADVLRDCGIRGKDRDVRPDMESANAPLAKEPQTPKETLSLLAGNRQAS